MTWVMRGQARLHVQVRGTGRPVLLLPALGRGVHDFDGLADSLSAAGYRAIMFSPRGVGKSTGVYPGLNIQDFVEDALAVLDAVAPGERAAIVGATFGNRVARALAQLMPGRMAAVVLLAAGGAVAPEPQATETARAAMAAIMAGRDPDIAEAQVYFSRQTDLTRSGLFARFTRDWWPDALAAQRDAARHSAPSVGVPNLPLTILQGADDRIAPPANGRALAQSASNARLIELPARGHLMLLEDTGDVTAAILSAIARGDWSGRTRL
ncbi:alpha/beta fold hydrolase [Roseovarius aestuarii]|nr:alpha/beta fold hydrolase [Roseovarius aestuarii]